MSGSAELITNEVRRLVLTCRHLQAELEQSIPKKTHQEIVTKMQETVDRQSSELKRTSAELEKAEALSSGMNALEGYLTTQGKDISSQREILQTLSAKLSENSVPQQVYAQTIAQNQELEEKTQRALEAKNVELNSLEMKNRELLERIAQMVPRSEYLAIQSHLTDWIPRIKHEEEVQKLRAQTVPREQYDRIESRLNELEGQLENSVPKSEFERLMKEITSITNAALTNEPTSQEKTASASTTTNASVPQPITN